LVQSGCAAFEKAVEISSGVAGQTAFDLGSDLTVGGEPPRSGNK
jgi:hypothetical protein